MTNNRKACLLFLMMSVVPVSYSSGQQATQAPPTIEYDKFQIPTTDDALPGVGPVRRFDWFQELWQEKRSRWANEVAIDQRALVFLGDSITQGWGANFGGSFPNVKTANRGISGDTTRGMLIRVDDDVNSLNPSGVVILMGTNDIEEQATPNQIAENIGLIIEKLKAHNAQMPIIVCQIFPSSVEKSRPAKTIQETNLLIANLVHGDPQITLLDTWSLFADESGDAKKLEFPDLLHPNESGYQKWAAALTPILATHDFLETRDDVFEIEPGFERLFNGTDLTGWCFLPPTEAMLKQRAGWQNRPDWPIVEQRIDFAGKNSTPDGRYLAKHGRLIVTIPPEGRRVQQLWTTREFPNNFTLRLEFRTTPNADSGIFLRGKQLQCRDFPLAGPYQELKAFRNGDWNALEVVVTGNVARCTCNGEILEESFELPSHGPLGLEGDRGQVEYRRIRIQETGRNQEK